MNGVTKKLLTVCVLGLAVIVPVSQASKHWTSLPKGRFMNIDLANQAATRGKRTQKPKGPRYQDHEGKFHQGLAAVKRRSDDGSEWIGFVDRAHTEIIKPSFEDAGPFSENLAAVKVAGRWGYINRAGVMMIAAQYDEAQDFSEGLAAVRIGPSWIYIGKKGKSLYNPPCLYKVAQPYRDGVAVVQQPKNLRTPTTRNGRVVMTDLNVKDRFTLINKAGKILGQEAFDEIQPFSCGLARVKKDGFFGFIDKTGQVVVSPEFSSAKDYVAGQAQVYSIDEAAWITLDTKGSIVPEAGTRRKS